MVIEWASVYREGLPEELPREGLVMNKMAVLHQNLGIIGKSTPSALEISLGTSLGSREISLALGMDFPIPPSF